MERARGLFDEAGALERRGQWREAQDRLRAALHLRETPNLHYALGWALENDDKLVEARTQYEIAMRLSQGVDHTEVQRLAAARIPEVDHATPLLQVRIKRGDRTLRVWIDGRELTLTDDTGTMPVDPGSHVMRVERSDASRSEQTIVVTRGAIRTIDVGGPTSLPKPPLAPWILVAGGAALAVSGAVLFVSSQSDVAGRNEGMTRWCEATACAGGTNATRPETANAVAYRREAYDAASRANTKQVVAGIFGGVAIVSLGIGAYLLLRKPTTTEQASRSRFQLEASPVREGALASASLTF
jgi:hypothetical protein